MERGPVVYANQLYTGFHIQPDIIMNQLVASSKYTRLAFAMRIRGETNRSLCAAIGINASYFSRAINKGDGLTRNWPAIALVLNVTEEWLKNGSLINMPNSRLLKEATPIGRIPLPTAEQQGQCLLIWRFGNDVPDELFKRAYRGGDEDWVALVPKGFGATVFLESENFGTKRDVTELPDGRELWVGCHA